MWIAKFKLKDDEDIYSPLCLKHNIIWYAIPYTAFEKNNKINLIAGGVISGTDENKKNFIDELKKDKRIGKIEQHHDFILVHARHPISRELKAEIKIFYNPQYIRVKPVVVSNDGWEYWEVGCLERNELNKLLNSAVKSYHGEIISVNEENLRNISSLEITPSLTEKQMESIKIAYKDGYYNYPRSLTIPQLAKRKNKSYSTFQEHLRKAENKIIDYFLKYR